MTAVDPQRLAREVEALGKDLKSPKSLRGRVVALLDIYANRTRHTAASADPKRAPWSFDVPAPILRTLKQYLREQLADKLELVWAIADELWLANYRETQMMAADMLSLQRGEQAAEWAEAHAAGSVDIAALAALAGSGLAGWRQADPQGFLARISTWLQGEEAGARTLGFHALAAAARDPTFENLPSIYSMLSVVSQPARGDARRAMFELVSALARRSPAETAHFLLERLERGGSEATRLARHVLGDLPAPQQAAVRKALSG